MTPRNNLTMRGIIASIVFVLIIFPTTSVLADSPNDPSCVITVDVYPPSPHVMNESDTLMLIVEARYKAGPTAEVMLFARELPFFAQGWNSPSDFCSDCVIMDTLYLYPDNCSSGIYDFRFVGIVDKDPNSQSEIVYVYDYHLTVAGEIEPCEIEAADSYTVIAGHELTFWVKYAHPDSSCYPLHGIEWDNEGYPFEHGAEFLYSGGPSRMFSWTPGLEDAGSWNVLFVGSLGGSTCQKKVTIHVEPVDTGCGMLAPIIMPEPEFTAGTSNKIYYRPQCNAYEHEVCYFDFESPGEYLGCRMTPKKSASQEMGLIEQIIEGLQDGHRYGYFVTAYFLEYPDSVSLSDTVTSTQDASPPWPVNTTTAEAIAGGVILVKWNGVPDDVSRVDRYLIYRKLSGEPYDLLATVAATEDNGIYTEYQLHQSLNDGTGLIEGMPYHYMVNAVDLVGNQGIGIETPAVIPDSTAPCVPELFIPFDYHLFFTSYINSTDCDVWGESNCSGLEEAHFIRFQAVRDSLKYFDHQWQEGYNFFASEWLPYEPDSTMYTFQFKPEDLGPDYVHGHTYYIRAQAKDSLGNISYWMFNDSAVYWSQADSVRVDLMPPDDIRNLTATPGLSLVDSISIVTVKWEPTTDHISGLKEYHVYRKIEGGEYEIISSIDTAGYVDSALNLDVRIPVCYRIGSVDNVGNIRDSSSWEACVLPHVGPQISIACDIIVGNLCYTNEDSVLVFWKDYNGEGVQRYIANCNGIEYVQNDPSKMSIFIPLSQDGTYSIKVRSGFYNGTVSTWSNIVEVIKDATPPGPIDSLWVDLPYPLAPCEYLRWLRPIDEGAGIGMYRVYRGLISDSLILVDSSRSSNASIFCGMDESTVYQNYTFEVHPVDHLGNEQDTGNARLTTICRRPPTIDSLTIDGGIVQIFWSRAMPNLSSNWGNSILVKREKPSSYDTSFYVLQDSSCFFDLNPHDTGYYEFYVKEIPLDLEGNPTSLWSRPKGISFNYKPPPVESIVLQPQPLLPEDEDQSKGHILIRIKYDRDELPGIFFVERYRDAVLEDTIIIRPDRMADTVTYMDTVLSEKTLYRYCVSFVDGNNLSSDPVCAEASIDPIWVFTPRVKPFPASFNDDSLTVEWEWVIGSDPDYIVVDTNFGAISCMAQISPDPTFTHNVWPAPWMSADNKQSTIFCYPDTLDGVRTLYARVRSSDSWENLSPWSEVYFGRASIIFDNMAPSSTVPENDRLTRTTAVQSPDSGMVDVYIAWKPSTDDGSGVAYYNVYMSSTGAWDLIDTVTPPDTYYLDSALNVLGLNTGDIAYKVQAVDGAGNEQDAGNWEEYLDIVPIPDHTADSKRDIRWSYSAEVDSFYAECSNMYAYLGNPDAIRGQDTGSYAWITNPESRSHTFNTGTNFNKPGNTIFSHMKAVRNGNESGWSSVDSSAADSAGEESKVIPTVFALSQNYPNPFNPATRIAFSLGAGGHVSLRIFNIRGQVVRTLVDRTLEAGQHTLDWDGTDNENQAVASGMYFYQIKSQHFTTSRKMVLVR